MPLTSEELKSLASEWHSCLTALSTEFPSSRQTPLQN